MAREDDAATSDPTDGDGTSEAVEAHGPGAPPPFVPGQRGVHHPRVRDGDSTEPAEFTDPACTEPADFGDLGAFGTGPATAEPALSRPTHPAAAHPLAPGTQPKAAPDPDDAPIHDGPSDAELADLVRAGDTDAYGLLYERHVHSIRRYARTCTRTPEAADDLCAEAFARTLQALRAGQGPREAFRGYLLTTVRHVAGDWTKSNRREWVTEDFTVFESAWENQDRLVRADDARLALQAFQDLPERSKVVLWHVDIEGEQAVQVAPLVGENPDNVRKILERARQELRDNYFVAFATGGVKDENCKKFTRYYGRHLRNRMDSEKRRESIDAHLKKCGRCNDTYAEMVDVRDRYGPIALALIGITAPMFLSGTALAAGSAAAATAAAGGLGLAVGAAGGGSIAGSVAASAAAAGSAAAGTGGAAGFAASLATVKGGGAGGGAAAGANQAGQTAARSALLAGGVVVAVAIAAFALSGNDKPTPRRSAPPVVASAPAPLPPAPPPPESRPPQPPPPRPPDVVVPDVPPAAVADSPPAPSPTPTPRPTRTPPARRPTPPATVTPKPKPKPKPEATFVVTDKEFRVDDNTTGFTCGNGNGKWCENPTITVPKAVAAQLMPPGSTDACTEIKGTNGSHYTLCGR